MPGTNIKKLKGFKPPFYRVRSGDYRILYRLQEKTIIIMRVIDRKGLDRVIKGLKLSKS
ncbi:MAG: type II toxin-antitoxin system RelE/ParE family toxin [Candidatus Aminicenantes bacterium]|nr:type II toxin-antitoxin system RelE/ParE family toxin [Candidatus Aminicenantes bacterium]